jgi:hypothetical protein
VAAINDQPNGWEIKVEEIKVEEIKVEEIQLSRLRWRLPTRRFQSPVRNTTRRREFLYVCYYLAGGFLVYDGLPKQNRTVRAIILSTWYERTRLRLYLRVPSWQSERDGSLVTGAKVAESPRAGTIPELLLKVNAHSGSGIPGQGRRNQPPLRLRWHRPWPARAPDSTAEVRYKGTYVFWNAPT